jgi:hypothetical protein
MGRKEAVVDNFFHSPVAVLNFRWYVEAVYPYAPGLIVLFQGVELALEAVDLLLLVRHGLDEVIVFFVHLLQESFHLREPGGEVLKCVELLFHGLKLAIEARDRHREDVLQLLLGQCRHFLKS